MGSVSDAQNRYETLRRQALESQSPARRQGLELGFIERQGLAAWLARGPEGLLDNTASLNSPTHAPTEGTSRGDLVLILTDLILGDPQEQCDGR